MTIRGGQGTLRDPSGLLAKQMAQEARVRRRGMSRPRRERRDLGARRIPARHPQILELAALSEVDARTREGRLLRSEVVFRLPAL